MIVDRLENAGLYSALHPGVAAALEWLAGPDPAAMPEARRELDGTRLYAMKTLAKGDGHGGPLLEAHRKYIDIHVALQGIEEIGWRPLRECLEISKPYNAEADCLIVDDAPTSWIALAPGSFAVFFPEDAHAPLAGDGSVLKIVLKIAMEWE